MKPVIVQRATTIYKQPTKQRDPQTVNRFLVLTALLLLRSSPISLQNISGSRQCNYWDTVQVKSFGHRTVYRHGLYIDTSKSPFDIQNVSIYSESSALYIDI